MSDTPPDEIPLFPLPDHVLLPGVPVPYRVFEPRYTRLVQDLLERPPAKRWLAVPRLAGDWESDYGGQPGFHPIAVAARLARWRPDNDGEFVIAVEGVTRCILEEVVSAHPYRMARARAFPDRDAGAGPTAQLRERLAEIDQGLLTLCGLLPSVVESVDAFMRDRTNPSLRLYRLAALLVPEPDDRQRLLELPEFAGRADYFFDRLTDLLARVGQLGSGRRA